MTVLNSLIYILICITYITGDFLSGLDKLDIDSKLRELNKAFNAIDNGDARVFGKNLRKPKHEEDQETEVEPSLGSAIEMLSGMFGGDCTYQCKNGKVQSQGCSQIGAPPVILPCSYQ